MIVSKDDIVIYQRNWKDYEQYAKIWVANLMREAIRCLLSTNEFSKGSKIFGIKWCELKEKDAMRVEREKNGMRLKYPHLFENISN